MPKVKNIALEKITQNIPLNNAKKSSNRIVKREQSKVADFDISCEDRGFFIYKGKVYNIIFPR